MPDELRKKAEELLHWNPEDTPVLSTADVQKLFHELDVHQIELQMQNEELRTVQAELAHSRDVYLELYDFAPVGYLTLDPEGRITEANFKAATLLGLDRGKLLVGHAFSGFVHRDSLERWNRHSRHLSEHLEKHGIDMILQRSGGSVITTRVESTPRLNARQEIEHYLLALVDITERVEAEEALRKSEQELAGFNLELERRVDEQTTELRESEEKYRKVFESETDAIMIFDAESRQFVDVNNAAIELYGYSREELLQLTQPAITAEPEASDHVINETLAGRLSELPHQSSHRKKDGTVFPVEIAECSFFLNGHQVACGVIRDISQRIAREQELRKLAAELSMAEQRERQRVAAELHDGVSQLLSSSYLRLSVLKESPLPASAIETIDKVCGILQDTLQQTRSLTFELSCPMLNELGLGAALEELCASMSSEYTIRFEFKGNSQPLPLHLDQQLVLYRSTRELLINVMKHSEATSARVDLEQGRHNVRIRVADDGRGFDAAMAGKSFSPSGGFGLFNIREYLQQAGGNLEIESIPGDGTQVMLTVPMEQDDG